MLWWKWSWGRNWMVQVRDPMPHDREGLIHQAGLWKGIPMMWLLLVNLKDSIRPPIASAFYEVMVHGHLPGQLQTWYKCLWQGRGSWRLWIGIGVRSTQIPFCTDSWLLLKSSFSSKPRKAKSDYIGPTCTGLSLCPSLFFHRFGSASPSDLSFWSSFLTPVYTWSPKS